MYTTAQKRVPVSLEPGEIHIWFTFPDDIHDEDLIAAYELLLIAEEQEKQRRFRFPRLRHQYLVTRALARTVLNRYTGIDPTCLHFKKNRYGKPELKLSEEFPRIRFNLSHTNGLIVCAVVLESEIGVDVEDIKHREVTEDLAKRFFSKVEVHDLHQLQGDKRRDRFFDYWTLKESYIKARGKGLSISLDQFTFHISDHEPLRISFDSRLKDHPDRWQFWLLKPTDRHKAAISAFSERIRDYSLIIRKSIPLAEDRHYDCEILRS